MAWEHAPRCAREGPGVCPSTSSGPAPPASWTTGPAAAPAPAWCPKRGRCLATLRPGPTWVDRQLVSVVSLWWSTSSQCADLHSSTLLLFCFFVADFLVCLGVSLCLLACLFVCFSHIGLCDVYSSSFGTNASEGSEISFAPHRQCWLRVKAQMRHLKMHIFTIWVWFC